MGLHVVEQLVVDALGGAPQRELPERREVAGRKEMLQGALGVTRQVDLAFPQPLQQVVGGDIDDLDVVGEVQDGIRHRLAHPDARDLRHDVVEALDVLDVQRRVDVDAGDQEFLDVLVTLRVAAARGVGMGQFVDEGDAGMAGDEGVQVHLVEQAALVRDRPARDQLEAFDEGLGFGAAVGLDDAGHDVHPVPQLGAGRGQHLVGLAHARGGAEEDLEEAAPATLAASFGQQGIGGRAPVAIRGLGHHRSSGFVGHRPSG